MAYLSWQERGQLWRERLEGAPVLGSDPQRATIRSPEGGAPVLAMMQPEGRRWRIRPLEGAVVRAGATMVPVQGMLLEDGDAFSIGTWELRFSEVFPGLDQDRFWETPGNLPLPAGSAATAALRWMASQAQRLERGLLAQEDPAVLARRLLDESRAFLSAATGVYFLKGEGNAMRTVHLAGSAPPPHCPSMPLVVHAIQDNVSLLSNDPLHDPRLGAMVPGAAACGPLLAAPVRLEDGSGGEAAAAAFVIVRAPGAPAFDITDLSLLQSGADLAALAHRLSLVRREKLSVAELEDQVRHLQREQERQDDRHGRLLAALGASLQHAVAIARRADGPGTAAILHQLSRMAQMVEAGQSTDPGLPPPPGRSRPLAEIQTELIESWAPLAEALQIALQASPAPATHAWLGGGPVIEALHSLVDPLLLQLAPGTAVPLKWKAETGYSSLDLGIPSGVGRAIPDAWSREVLATAGIDYRWGDGVLSLLFHAAPREEPEFQVRPMLGLVTEDLPLATLFQGASDADGLGLFPLEEAPPAPPLPSFEILVIDAEGLNDVVACVRAYRAHPAFATTPILVVRAHELSGPDLTEAGATDWLTGGVRWESLHHRLQALRGHRELQRKGRAAERLETVRQMAGTLKHEINNPLAVISLQTELLQRKFPDEPKLAKIVEQVQRIQGLMQVLQKMREPGDEDYPGGTNILKL